MAVIAIASTVERFTSRLSTLEHLLSVGANHFQADEESYLGKRLSQDMHPLGTQVAFTCNKAGWISIRLVQEKAKEKIDNVVQLIKITFPWGFT